MSNMDTPELIAICYDEDFMCSCLHSDTTERGHPERPVRLAAILERLRGAKINLAEYGERKMLDFTRNYECRPADRNTLYYCHSERHVKQLVRCCREIAQLNDDCDSDRGEKVDGTPFITMYPLDQDTYLTSKSEQVARVAVGGIIKLANILMAGDMPAPPIPAISRSTSTVNSNGVQAEDAPNPSGVAEFADFEKKLLSSVVSKHVEEPDLQSPTHKPEREDSCASFYGNKTDTTRASAPRRRELSRLFSMDNLMRAFKGMNVSGDSDAPCPPPSVRKGFALLRPPGHHATREKMMGFCLYNNVAIAAAHLKRTFGLKRIAIVDIDVHHGNGTQDIFYNDSSVLVISTHRFGTDKQPFYPHSGNSSEMGGPMALGYNVNIPLSAGYTTHDMIYSFQHVVLPKLESFQPEFVLVSCGFDAAKDDYLGGCQVTPDGYSWLVLELCRVAERHSNGRLLLALEGGYNPKVNADCTEAIFRTIMGFEMDRSFTVQCKYDTSKVKKSTSTVCGTMKRILKNAGASPSRLSSFASVAYDEADASMSVKWTRYRSRLDDDSLVIAGGHLNQFLLPRNPAIGELGKLCSPSEVAFYRWLYEINHRKLEVVNRECKHLILPFSAGDTRVSITGVRLVTDPTAVPTVKPQEEIAPACEPPAELEGGTELVRQLINFVVECTGIYTSRVFAGWRLVNSHTNAIRLRNALHNMRAPCAMDLKMGTRLYGDDVVDPSAIARKELKAAARSCKTHGFHISGMFHWDRSRQKVLYLHEKVAHVLKDDDELVAAFSLFLNRVPSRDLACRVIDKLVAKLVQLRSVFERQKQLALYGTSLLFVFDAQAKRREDVLASADVFMIDLSHASYNTGCIDKGYLLGLRTVIIMLNETKKAIKERKKFLVF